MNIADNAHNTSAVALGRILPGTQTVVAIWSSFYTCVLRLTRVRALSYARLSVSRVCVMYSVAAYAIFLVPPALNRLVLRSSL